MGTKLVKIGEDIYNKVKEFAEKRGTTIRDITERALLLYLQGVEVGQIEKEIKGIVSKDIIVQFKARCFICKKPIEPGEVAHFIKITYTDNSSRSYLAHLSCYTERYEESLAKAIIRREKIKTEIKSLEKYRDKLINEIVYKYEKILQLEDKIIYLAGANDLRMVHHNHEILEQIKDCLLDIKYLLEEKVETIKKLSKEAISK